MFVLILFCVQLLVCVLLGVSILWPLTAGLVLFLLYGLTRGFSLRALGGMVLSGIAATKTLLLVFLLIGVLTALWRACGTVPYIICCAVGLIRPGTVVLMTFLLNCAVSVLTGTAFGTAATMGTICMSVALSLGISPVLTGGAILSGVFFGDRWSPVSTSALLVSELTKTDLYSNLRAMVRTAAVPFLLSCVIYAVLGFTVSGSLGKTEDLWALFGQALQLHWITLLPAVLILVLALFRVQVRLAMSFSILAAAVIALTVQHCSLPELLRVMVFGYSSGYDAVDVMLAGGGLVSMVRVVLIVCISAAYSRIFRETGLLEPLHGLLRRFSRRDSYPAILLTSLFSAMLFCNQTLAIMLTHQLCGDIEPDAPTEALQLEDSAVICAALIPWSISAGVPLGTVGAPTESILAACFLYLMPLCRLLRRKK